MYIKNIKDVLLVWMVGLVGGVLFTVLRITKRVEIAGACYKKEKFNHKGKGLVIIANHPSLWEPCLLPFLLFPRYLFSLRFIPYSLVDKKNYYDKWWFQPLRFVCVPIKRGSPREELTTIKKTLQPMLKEGKILILFPEGGRTFKCIKLRGVKYSRSGKKIARFPRGIEKLFLGVDCLVLPIWTEGGDKVIPNKEEFPKIISIFPRVWRKTRIVVGENLTTRGFKKGELLEHLENTLLNLAELSNS